MSADAASNRISMVSVDPYRALGIDRQATGEEIKRSYFQLVRQFSPEREPDKFQEIRAAYEILRDAERRAEIDLFLLQPPPPLPRRRSPNYDLAVHPPDLIALMVDAVTPPMAADFGVST